MQELEIIDTTVESITQSFDQIAKKLFEDYKLIVNDNHYRFIDLEFYYYSSKIFEDIFVHKHEAQLQKGKWYFHGSGIDITFGNGKNHGGILIRAIAKISTESTREKKFIEKEIQGPINVKTEICSKLNGAFDTTPNDFAVYDISRERMGTLMLIPEHIIKTRRIGLNPDKDISNEQSFYNGKFRYVIFPHLKLKDKTQIAVDMQSQFPNMTKEEINREFGSKFL